MQLSHYDKKFTQKQFPIILICDNISNAPNIGSLFRIADAMGVEKIFFCGQDIPIGRRMTKTSRSTEKHVNFEVIDSIDIIMNNLSDYQLIALEITEDSKPLSTIKIIEDKPIALIVGSENHGVNDNTLNICDDIVHINMYGHNSSMNVVQATSIALFEITRKLNS